MMFCVAKDPLQTRLVILSAFVAIYALYHVIRWYARRPKSEKPEAAGSAAAPSVPQTVLPPAEPKTVKQEVPSLGKTAVERPKAFVPPPVEPRAVEVAPPPVVEDLKEEDAQKLMERGKYAWSKGLLVEAHYWTTLARALGARGLAARLVQLERDWQARGCPDETFINHGDRGKLAQAYMCFKCGIGRHRNAEFILSCAESGSRSARLLARYEQLSK